MGDNKLVSAFRDAMKKLEKAEWTEQLLRKIYRSLQSVTLELEKHLGPEESSKKEPTKKRGKRRTRKRGKLVRLTAEQKRDRQEILKLRSQAHQLVITFARTRNSSPAKIYQELTQKYGHPAREAGKKELQDRIAYLTSAMSQRKKKKSPSVK